MFADDTTIDMHDTSIDRLVSRFKKDMSFFTDWVNHNQLIINFDKTNIMILTNKHIQKIEKIELHLNNDVVPIEVVDKVKLLGIELDNKLTFSNYLSTLTQKINKKLYSVRKLFFLNHSLKIQFFKSFILPHFDYCSSLFVYFSHTLINQIEHLFNSIIKKLLRIDLTNLSYDNQLSILKDVNILPFKIRLFYRFSLFSYKLLNSNCLLKICKSFEYNQNSISYNYNLRNQDSKIVNIINRRTKSGDKCLSFILSKFVNNIIKHSYNLNLKDYKSCIFSNLLNQFNLFNDSFFT